MTLSIQLRPHSLKEIIGQTHLVGKNGIIKTMAEKNDIKPLLLWGPSGIGKTTIARCLSNDADYKFIELNATNTKIADIRSVVQEAIERKQKTLVFVDEIHRWAKNIQDALLPHVEEGTICLIGATTEKPQFAVNTALRSRMLEFELKPLNNKELAMLVVKIVKHYRMLKKEVKINKETVIHFINKCGGDARKLMNSFECIVDVIMEDNVITKRDIDSIMPNQFLHFDKSGNEHFDLAAAWQNSVQHSDVDQAIYFLAKWLLSGEDPVYIARRILISASEDACMNPNAAMIANNAYIAAKEIGYPECKIPMAHATIEITRSQRDKVANNAIARAEDHVKSGKAVIDLENMGAGKHDGYSKVINETYVIWPDGYKH